ncbi:MAG: vWA domain-containing protein [Gemmatimonadales bacterium]
MTFDSPLLLLLAPLMGGVLGGLGWLARRARLRATAIWSPASAAPVLRTGRAGPWLLGAAGLLGGIGLAGPRWGRSVTEREGRALNLAIGVDISRSMLAEDVAPNRLQRAVGEAQRLVQDARGDRLALLGFSSRSYILTPLTLDDGAVTLQLDALDPEIASEGGTDLEAVLVQGGELLNAAAERGARVLVLFTDGETHGSIDAAQAAARALRDAGITLVMVGEGDTLLARIPIRDEQGRLTGYQTDEVDEIVHTWRRDDVLRSLADAAGGVLISATDADQAGGIRRVLEGLERSATREERREEMPPRGWLFGFFALALVALQAAWRRGPAIAGVLLTLGSLGTGSAQRPSAGSRLLERHDTTRAAAAFAEEAARGRVSPDTAYFNAGTAALARARFAEARRWLGLAARSLDPELRFRALYNLGLVAFHEALRNPERKTELHQEAAARFREALLLEPESFDAKWNLELVQTLPPPGGGGAAAQSRAPPATRPAGAVALTDAEQILNSVERSEREVLAEQARRRRATQVTPRKDW